MTGDQNNKITIENSTLKADQLGIGYSVTLTQNIYRLADEQPTDQLATSMKALAQGMQEHLQSPQQEKMLQMLESIATEMKNTPPNDSMILAMLQGLEQGLGSVARIGVLLTPFALAVRSALGS